MRTSLPAPLVLGLAAALLASCGGSAPPRPGGPTSGSKSPSAASAGPASEPARPEDREVHLLPPALLPPCEGSQATLSAMDPEGRLLVTVPYGGCHGAPAAAVLRFWDPRTGALRGSLPPLAEPEEDIALSSGGARLAVAFRRSVAVYDVGQRKQLRKIAVPDPVETFWLHFVPGSETLLTLDDTFGSKVIDAGTGAVRVLARSTISTTAGAAIQPPITTAAGAHLLARVLTTHTKDDTTLTEKIRVAVFDLDSAAETATLVLSDTSGQAPVPSIAALSPGGEAVAIGYKTGDLEIWDVRTATRRTKIAAPAQATPQPGGGVLDVVWEPSGKALVAAGADGVLRRWEAAGGAKLGELPGIQPAGGALVVTAAEGGSTRVAMCGPKGAGVWDTRTGKVERSPALPPSAEGTCLASARGDAFSWVSRVGVATWTAGSARIGGSHEEAWATPHLARWTPDGRHLLLGFGESIAVLDARDGHVEWSRAGLGRDAIVSPSPDGSTIALVAGDAPGRVRRLRFATGEEAGAFDAAKDGVSEVSWSPDGKRLAITAGGGVTLFDAATGARQESFGNAVAAAERAIFHPTDGSLAVLLARSIPPSAYMPMAGNECLVQKWDPGGGAGKVLYTESAAGTRCFPAAPVFEPGGARLVFIEKSGLRLTALDMATGKDGSWGTAASGDVAYRPDGGVLGALMWGGVARLFSAPDFKQIAELSPPGLPATSFAWGPSGDVVFLGHAGGGYILRRGDGASVWLRIWHASKAAPLAAAATSDGSVSGDEGAIAHLRFHTGPDPLGGEVRTGAELSASRRDPQLLGRITSPVAAP